MFLHRGSSKDGQVPASTKSEMMSSQITTVLCQTVRQVPGSCGDDRNKWTVKKVKGRRKFSEQTEDAQWAMSNSKGVSEYD